MNLSETDLPCKAGRSQKTPIDRYTHPQNDQLPQTGYSSREKPLWLTSFSFQNWNFAEMIYERTLPLLCYITCDEETFFLVWLGIAFLKRHILQKPWNPRRLNAGHETPNAWILGIFGPKCHFFESFSHIFGVKMVFEASHFTEPMKPQTLECWAYSVQNVTFLQVFLRILT